MDPLIENVAYSTEESIINALIAAESMKGFDDHFVSGIPHDKIAELFDSRRE